MKKLFKNANSSVPRFGYGREGAEAGKAVGCGAGSTFHTAGLERVSGLMGRSQEKSEDYRLRKVSGEAERARVRGSLRSSREKGEKGQWAS